jgi:hypothetical protein
MMTPNGSAWAKGGEGSKDRAAHELGRARMLGETGEQRNVLERTHDEEGRVDGGGAVFMVKSKAARRLARRLAQSRGR